MLKKYRDNGRGSKYLSLIYFSLGCLVIFVAGCAPDAARHEAWPKAVEAGPVLSKGRSDFSSNAVPLPGGRGIWVLDGAQVDAACGQDRPGSLVFRNTDKGRARAWVQIPPYDEVDDYIFPNYEVRFWVKHADVTASASKILACFEKFVGDDQPQILECPVKGAADWQEQVFRIRSEGFFLKGTLVFEFCGNGTVWVDDVQIEWPRKRPGAMPKGAVQIMDVNGGWTMKTDPDDKGITERWYDPAVKNVEGWSPVEVPKWLPLKGKPIVAWERVDIAMPALKTKGQRLFLHFGAVDCDADVWVNGKHVLTHSGWEDPFVCEITTCVTPGAKNLVMLRVTNPVKAPGGIYKPVTLHAVGN